VIVTGTYRRDGSRNLIIGVGEQSNTPLTRYVINDPDLVIDDGAAVVVDEDTVIIAAVTYRKGTFEERQGVFPLTRVD